MRLQYGIAINLAFITCLSAFMLGIGQNDAALPLLMFFTALVSLYVTDFRRWIRLGDWTVNAIVLLIVFFTLGDILRNRGEDLAFSIARVLVFVEMVLVFREKAPRFCWQILLISLLQVVVATVFQQSMLFGLLLLLYVFAGLLVFLLIFLDKENHYFRKHSFVSTFWETVRSEIAERQDRWKLVRIALVTLLTGPLSLVFSFEKTNNEEEVFEGGKTFTERLRALLAVFPTEATEKSGHWETVAVSSSSTENRSWFDAIWTDAPVPATPNEKPIEKTIVPVPAAQRRFRWRRNKKAAVPKSRFPLLRERPGFSAGTLQANGWEGGKWELSGLLVRGLFVSLMFAVILFCLIPRIGKIGFYELDFVFGHDNWQANFIPPVNTVGFSEEVRLGSLGTVIPYYREVMSIRPTKNRDNRSPIPTSTSLDTFYGEMEGNWLFLRGVALDHYENGIWTAKSTSISPNPEVSATPEFIMRVPSWNLHPGIVITEDRFNAMFFEEDTDIVDLHLTVQPLNSKVFFAPWPFFRKVRRDRNQDSFTVRFFSGRMEEVTMRGGEGTMTIYSTAFRNGQQLEITPCVEKIRSESLLQMPETGLESLTALAKQWDDESKIDKADIVGRARSMERRFFTDERFRYQLGGTSRSYGVDPLEDFVCTNPVGHCEYFSGALALMLRSVGMESRVIVGFKTLAKSPGKDGYCVRQSDAHTWVEIHLPHESLVDRQHGPFAGWWVRGGWLRLDPTPDSAAPTFLNNVSFSMTDLSQWIQGLWGEYVLNMDSEKQAVNIYQPLRHAGQFILERVFNTGFWFDVISNLPALYGKTFVKGKTEHWSASHWTLLIVPILLALAILFLIFRSVWPLWFWFRRMSEKERRRRVSIDFYVRMEKILAKHGRKRRLGETPKEYASGLTWSTLTLPVVDAFYRVRYGGAELSDHEMQSVRVCLDDLEKELELARINR